MKERVYLYIIKCSAGVFYVGISKHVEKRLSQHNNGKSKFTSKFLDWVLVFNCVFPSRKEAYLMEKKAKRMGALRFMHRYAVYNELQANEG